MDATTDGLTIRHWWAQWPDANVGIVTGGKHGLLVLDVDPRHGGDDSLCELERQHGPLPDTVESLTGGGGRHLLFQHPGGSITSRPIAPGLDIKADGGYVVAPPSVHASGEVYRWEGASHPDDVPLAPLPPWLEELLTAQRPRAGLDRAAEGALAVTIREGQRNQTLTSLAGTMRRRGMSEAAIRQALQIHNAQSCVPPLPEEEVTRIAASVARYAPAPSSARSSQVQGDGKQDTSSRSRPGQADTLIHLCDQSETVLFHDQFQEAYAWVRFDDRREVLKVRSGRFRRWLALRMWDADRKAPSREALQCASTTLAARALYTGPEYHLWNRVARHEGAIWYDLGGTAVRISPDGWELIKEPPLLFVRYTHQRPQVDPVDGGDLRTLLRWVNLPESGLWLGPAQLLFLVYAVVLLVPDIPHPVLCIHGEQGSGKTTFLKIIRDLIDPSSTPILGPQDTLREFVQLAAHHWAVYLDNLSALPDWLSDAICRCVTGEGFSKRELYSDDEDILYSFRRCIGLNGINLVPSKPDLLDRVLICSLERIPDASRRTEAEFWATFQAEKPRLLGALLTTLSQAMALVDTVRVPGYPRLADFARWGIAVARALGAPDQAFLGALAANTRAQTSEALQASPVAQALLQFLEGKPSWRGSPTALLKELNQVAEQAGVDTKGRLWPKDARWVWRRIKEVRPNLQAAGWQVDHRDSEGKASMLITRLDGENDGSVPL
jgi:energy-coupling factor transporter ATP-binding protein EcfA2